MADNRRFSISGDEFKKKQDEAIKKVEAEVQQRRDKAMLAARKASSSLPMWDRAAEDRRDHEFKLADENKKLREEGKPTIAQKVGPKVAVRLLDHKQISIARQTVKDENGKDLGAEALSKTLGWKDFKVSKLENGGQIFTVPLAVEIAAEIGIDLRHFFFEEHRHKAWDEFIKHLSAQEAFIYDQQQELYDPEDFNEDMVDYSQDSIWEKYKTVEGIMKWNDTVTAMKYGAPVAAELVNESEAADALMEVLTAYEAEQNKENYDELEPALDALKHVITKRKAVRLILTNRCFEYPLQPDAAHHALFPPQEMDAVEDSIRWFLESGTYWGMAQDVWGDEAIQLAKDLGIKNDFEAHDSERKPPQRSGLQIPVPEVAPAEAPVDVPENLPALPVYGDVLAIGSEKILLFGGADATTYMTRPFFLAGRGMAYGVNVHSESMEPVFRVGAQLYVDPSRPCKGGDDVIVQIKDGDEQYGIVKRYVSLSQENLTLQQFNPPKELTIQTDKIVAIHKVIGSLVEGS